MDSSPACPPHETSPCNNVVLRGWSLKKLQLQRLKAQARSLKLLRAAELLQEEPLRGSHFLDIDALVEQAQQRHKEAEEEEEEEEEEEALEPEASPASLPLQHPDTHHDPPIINPANGQHKLEREFQQPSSDITWPWGGKGAKSSTRKHPHQRQQSMRAAVESRRRLARGPRSGSATAADAGQTAGAGAGAGAAPMLPSEDHRVVSTDYQAAGTQALMRVTLLAAGFVIGARGISARLIGQVTGAIVQSWTESCRPDSIPIRLFRIQGKKAVVQAAVALIEQAVAKYKDLCECKRRGEFVQREHIINGVEFYYQPPPRKAFANANEQPPKPGGGGDVAAAQLNNNTSPVSSAVPFAPHHVWLQHLQQQHQHTQAQAAIHLEASQGQLVKGGNGLDGQNGGHRAHLAPRQSHAGFFDWQPQQERQQGGLGLHSPESEHTTAQDCGATELELIDHGLQQSVASLEKALQQVRLEQRLLHRNRSTAVMSICNNNNNNNNCNDSSSQQQLLHQHNQILKGSSNNSNSNSLWSDMMMMSQQPTSAAAAFQLGSSLFSIFGDGGLPLPISPPDERPDAAATHCNFLDSTPCTPFDFPRCDFLRDSLPSFAACAAAREAAPTTPYPLYEASPPLQQQQQEDALCIVCLEQLASVHLVTCGHDSFCFSCVGGLLTCPLCREPIVALHPRGCCTYTSNGPAPDLVLPKLNNTSSSYQLWNWVPGASV